MINSKEWLEISLALENHHAIFYKLWQMGKPELTTEIDTAAVKFDREGNYFLFLFNPDFWESLDFYNKLFVICHECLHVILNHGVRIKDTKNATVSNQALDIVVNHLLVDKFYFERNKIKDWGDYCWADTVFPDQKISHSESYEYYYNIFKKTYGDGSPLKITKTVDEHNFEFDVGEVLKNIKELSDEEKRSLINSLGKNAGEGGGGYSLLLLKSVKKKKKWESIIKKWSTSTLKQADFESEQWARLNRRLSMLPQDMFLPSDMEIEEVQKTKDKIEVYFFLDTSESCWEYKTRFFYAAQSLSEKKFKIHLYCFDTLIKETTLESKRIYGGGGTSFKIINDFINKLPKQPDGVFVITDGYGDFINPQKPERWHWFLTKDNTKSFISKKCNFYELSEFE